MVKNKKNGIFDFSHPRFDTVSAKFDGSGVEGKRIQSSGICENSTFLVACV
jgi:hypothetical protein